MEVVDFQQLAKSLIFRIFAHERKFFSTDGLLVRLKFRIILTISTRQHAKGQASIDVFEAIYIICLCEKNAKFDGSKGHSSPILFRNKCIFVNKSENFSFFFHFLPKIFGGFVDK